MDNDRLQQFLRRKISVERVTDYILNSVMVKVFTDMDSTRDEVTKEAVLKLKWDVVYGTLFLLALDSGLTEQEASFVANSYGILYGNSYQETKRLRRSLRPFFVARNDKELERWKN